MAYACSVKIGIQTTCYGKQLKLIQMTNNIFYFEDWIMTMLSNSDYSETELMEFEEHYQNLLDFETNTDNFIKLKTD